MEARVAFEAEIINEKEYINQIPQNQLKTRMKGLWINSIYHFLLKCMADDHSQ